MSGTMKESYGGIDEGAEYKPCDPKDFSKLRIGDGVIHYRLYQQDGSMVEMEVEDTYSNRLFVSWVQIHDRELPGPEWRAKKPSSHQ